MSYTNGLDKPSDYFNTVLYTGNGTAIGSGGNAITGVGFQPDFLWIKNRSSALHHGVFDVVRGTPKRLLTSSNVAEDSNTETVDSFDADGFTVGSNSNVNGSGNNLVAWNFLAGGTASSNTDGSITSNVSANTTSGFSIVSWTGSGANATIGHGIDTPKMIIVKQRTDATTWYVGHDSLGWDKYINLDKTSASTTNTTLWQNTAPTSSVFSVGSSNSINGSGDSMIAYCFAEKKGFSKAFSYTGNGSSDGSFTYLGFRPAWVMIKKTSGTGNWCLFDNKRGVNGAMIQLNPDNTNADNTSDYIDFLSNGFKCRNTASDKNASGGSYIGIAFAENPLVSTAGVTCTAR